MSKHNGDPPSFRALHHPSAGTELHCLVTETRLSEWTECMAYFGPHSTAMWVILQL